MKKAFLALVLCGVCLMEVTCTAEKEPVDYVNP